MGRAPQRDCIQEKHSHCGEIALRTTSNTQENNEKAISFCTHGKSEQEPQN